VGEFVRKLDLMAGYLYCREMKNADDLFPYL
jgi:hypothetical protein